MIRLPPSRTASCSKQVLRSTRDQGSDDHYSKEPHSRSRHVSASSCRTQHVALFGEDYHCTIYNTSPKACLLNLRGIYPSWWRSRQQRAREHTHASSGVYSCLLVRLTAYPFANFPMRVRAPEMFWEVYRFMKVCKHGEVKWNQNFSAYLAVMLILGIRSTHRQYPCSSNINYNSVLLLL